MNLKDKTKNIFSNLKDSLIKIRSNQTVLICSLMCVLYLISGYWKWLEIAVSLCAITFMALLPLQNAFCIFMFSHCFTLSYIGYDSCFMVTLIGFCLILFVKYWIGVSKGKYLYHKKLVTSIAVFYSISTALSLFKPLYNGAWLYLTYLPLIYLVFAMREEFDIAQGMNFMLGGIISSCSLALITLTFPQYQYKVIVNGRFQSFFNNTNYLYIRAVFILSYYMYRHLNKNISNINFVIILCLCSLITLATLSKTGIVMLAILILIYIIMALKQDFKKRIKFVGLFCLVLLIIGAVGYKYVLSIFNRFVEAFNSSNFINSLLTQRDEIWTLYFNEIFESPFTLLFGHGLVTEQVFVANVFGPTETHNFYIWLLYRFGILGTIYLGYIIYLFVKELKPERPKSIAWLPLIFLLLESLCDNTMKCYNITYFLFAIMILFMNKQNNVPIQTKNNINKQKIKD